MCSPRKILIVDDEPINRFTLEMFLTRSGWHVALAKDGVEALDLIISDETLGWILLDLNMPRLDGYGVLKAINEQHSKYRDKLKIVILSASSEEDFIANASVQGLNTMKVVSFMRKPVDLSALRQLLMHH